MNAAPTDSSTPERLRDSTPERLRDSTNGCGTWLRSRDAGYTALVAILSVLLLLPALVQPSRLVYPSWSDFSDLTLIHWPKVLLVRESLAQGHGWPLWSPYALSGQPLAANQLAMLFYPPALILLLGPMAWSFSLFYALHLAWAGVGTYWLVRGLGRQPESALLAGTIWALSGKLAAHTAIGHASLVPAIAWTPWALAFLHRALTQPRNGFGIPPRNGFGIPPRNGFGIPRSTTFALLTGVALAAQITTHTYALIYTAYGLLLYTALHLGLGAWEQRRKGTELPYQGRGNGAPIQGGETSHLLGGETSHLLGGETPPLLRSLARLALVPLVAIWLAAAQLLPLLEMAPHSNRALSLEAATYFSLSPAQTLTGILFPTPNVGHEWMIYPGLLTLGLAAAAWYARRERAVVILSILTALGAILALGDHTPLYRLAYGVLPGLRWMRTPARLWFFVTLGLAVLAAYGFEAWGKIWRNPGTASGFHLGTASGFHPGTASGFYPARRPIRLVLIGGMGLALALSLGVMILFGQWGRGAWGLGVFGLLDGALLLWASGLGDRPGTASGFHPGTASGFHPGTASGFHRERAPTPLFATLALLLIVADLLSFDLTLVRFIPTGTIGTTGTTGTAGTASGKVGTQAQVLAKGQDAAEWLASQPGPFRVYSPSYSLPQPAVSLAGLQQIDGVEPVHLANYDRFMALAGGYDQGPFSVTIPPFSDGVPLDQAHRQARPDLRLLGLLNGRYLAAAFPMDLPGLALRWQEAGTWIYENELALPRAFVVHQVETVTDEEVWDRLADLDPARVALVEQASESQSHSGSGASAGFAGGAPLDGADLVEQSPNRLVVETELASPGLLVLSEIWYPGWQARDNGRQVPILRTDAILRGVYLEAGPHTVEFRYSPWTVSVGLALSGSAVLALLVYGISRIPKSFRGRIPKLFRGRIPKLFRGRIPKLFRDRLRRRT